MSYFITLEPMFRLYQQNTVTPNEMLCMRWSEAKNLWGQMFANAQLEAGLKPDELLSEATSRKLFKACSTYTPMVYYHEEIPVIKVTVDVYEVLTSGRKWQHSEEFKPGLYKPGWITGYEVTAKFAGTSMSLWIAYGGKQPEKYLDDNFFIAWAREEIKRREVRMEREIQKWIASTIRVSFESKIPMPVDAPQHEKGTLWVLRRCFHSLIGRLIHEDLGAGYIGQYTREEWYEKENLLNRLYHVIQQVKTNADETVMKAFEVMVKVYYRNDETTMVDRREEVFHSAEYSTAMRIISAWIEREQ